ncbi:response regulator transcription factor [Cellulomonas sp. URHE0023]|uniref:response regulator n=1 Tax=Cellulomonas sp. URHE0023 TaxID=1380354 RepID=UPI000480EEF0|nr:response regulator transcription factor [Cellulomonas sp. URHE0023]
MLDTATGPIRVVIADDHPVVRRGLAALITSIDGLEVVGEAADGASAVRETQLLRPDAVIMDIAMPGVDGLEATRRIVAAVPDVAVLVLTMHDDDDTVFAAMQAGARGYLLKGADQDDIAHALRAVVSGQAIFGPGVARRVLGYLSSTPQAPGVVFPELTAREREVLDLIARGSSNATIAAQLHLSPKTVGNHISSIFAKLAVASRAEAIVRARQGGLGRT